ncbi:MAG: flagellar biosynthetic protein FliO [Acetatifactor sp.]|nr:flagellar biosynthetic protein FliO [Acetatifactor sp.]
MAVLLSGSLNSYIEFITVLVIFVLVLGATALTTRWIAGYQKKQISSGNIEVIDTARIGNNKFIQIVKIGDTYKVVALGKDEVTYLGDISADEIHRTEPVSFGDSFKSLLSKYNKSSSSEDGEAKDDDNEVN